MTDVEKKAWEELMERAQDSIDAPNGSFKESTAFTILVAGKELAALRAEVERLREDYERACATVAAMHSAAVGEVRGPILGVVEDVASLLARVALYERALDKICCVRGPWHGLSIASIVDELRAALDAAKEGK